MRWNRTHPVPWRRFLREGVVFGLGMALVFFVFVGERKPGSYVGIAFGKASILGFLSRRTAAARDRCTSSMPRRTRKVKNDFLL